MKLHFSVAPAAFSLALAVCASGTFAQAPVRLADAVVTATRFPQAYTDVLADVSVIDRAEIERLGSPSVTQLLQRLPGMQTIGWGDSARVYVRGSDSRMTALYIDGVRVDSQDGLVLGGGAPWDLIAVSEIDHIEVLRGPASAVYGSDAMGGVVQIFTRKRQGAGRSEVSLGVGSLNTQKANASIAGGQGAWTYALGLGYERSDGHNTRPDLVHTPETEPMSQRSTSLRTSYRLNATQSLDFSVFDSQRDSRYVPWNGGKDYEGHGATTAVNLKWQAQWTPQWRSALTTSLGKVSRRDDAPNDFRTETQGWAWENQVRAANGNVTAVVEHRQDGFDAYPTAWDPSIQGQRSQDAVALGYGMTSGAHTLELQTRNDQDSQFGNHTTGAAAYAWNFSQRWRFTASTGTAFRAPTLEQTFGPYGSTQLQPETNHSTEWGLRYATDKTQLRAITYRNEVSSMISSSMSLSSCAAGFFCYYNVGQASMRGITLSGSHQFTHFDVYGSMDFLDATDDITGKQLSLRARKMVNAGMRREEGSWQWGMDLRSVGERFDDAANTRLLNGYRLINLYATKTLSKTWKLQMRVDNATEETYQEVGSFATPGRTVFATLKWQGAN